MKKFTPKEINKIIDKVNTQSKKRKEKYSFYNGLDLRGKAIKHKEGGNGSKHTLIPKY